MKSAEKTLNLGGCEFLMGVDDNTSSES